MGTEKSGFSAHVRGWHLGVRVWCNTDTNGDDFIDVSLTGGSNDSSTIKCLGRYFVREKEKYGNQPIAKIKEAMAELHHAQLCLTVGQNEKWDDEFRKKAITHITNAMDKMEGK
jgi:hypothetical protein